MLLVSTTTHEMHNAHTWLVHTNLMPFAYACAATTCRGPAQQQCIANSSSKCNKLAAAGQELTALLNDISSDGRCRQHHTTGAAVKRT